MQSTQGSSVNFLPTGLTSLRDMFPLCLLAVIIVIRYHSVINSFWLYDDPYILRHAFEHSSWEYFLVPDAWREMSVRYLTPWVSLSFDLDMRLFGLHPRFFYIHQLLSIWLSSVFLYLVLRLWISRWFAAFGSLLFINSAPVAAAAEMLMIRHYIEGLIFCLLAVYFFAISLRKESVTLSILSALFYALAMSAKELYVPLLAAIIFLPEGRLRKRITYAAPLAVVFVLYSLWRYWMLGDFIAGPDVDSALRLYEAKGATRLFLKNLYSTIVMMSGASVTSKLINPLITIVLLFFFGLSCFFLVKEKKYPALIFFLVLSAAVYSVPLSAFNPFLITSEFTAYRVAFLISAYLSISLSCALSLLWGKADTSENRTLKATSKTTCIASTLVVFSLIQWNSFSWIVDERVKTIRPLTEEGKFFMTAGRNKILVKSDPVFCGAHYFANLEFFRKFYLKEETPLVVYNGFAYPDGRTENFPDGLRIYKYSARTGAMSDFTDSFFKERDLYLSRIRRLPLSVRLDVDGGLIDFTVGPSTQGHYFLLWGHKPGLYSMYIDFGPERKITTRGLTVFKIYWRFGWESPEGWVTFSPEWFIDFSKKQSIVWEQR